MSAISCGVADSRCSRRVVENGGLVRSINVTGGASMSRSRIDGLIAYAQEQGAGGMAWMKVTENGLESNIVKFFDDDIQKALVERLEGKPGDLLIFVADKPSVVYKTLGAIRLKLGHDLELIDESRFEWLFVTEFPMFELDEETKEVVSMHHAFTAPYEDDIDKLDTDPLSVRSRSYDLVLNGNEIVSGSIRIHNRDLQKKIFDSLGIGDEGSGRKIRIFAQCIPLRCAASRRSGIRIRPVHHAYAACDIYTRRHCVPENESGDFPCRWNTLDRFA